MMKLIQTQNATESAMQLAKAVAQNLRSVLTQQERATLAVSGGKSPVAFFQALSQIELEWQRINITLVDERLVPTQHSDSNTQLVRQNLLQNQAAVANWLPMVDDEADEAALKNIANAVDFALNHFVQADIVVLGMGNDGHTASIFPQAPQFAEAISGAAPALLHTTPQTAPHERISMSLNSIEKARFVYLAIAGAEKKAVYERAVQKIDHTLPISLILNSQKVDTHVFYHD